MRWPLRRLIFWPLILLLPFVLNAAGMIALASSQSFAASLSSKIFPVLFLGAVYVPSFLLVILDNPRCVKNMLIFFGSLIVSLPCLLLTMNYVGIYSVGFKD